MFCSLLSQPNDRFGQFAALREFSSTLRATVLVHKSKVYLQEAKTQANFAKQSFAAFRVAEQWPSVFDVFFHLQHFLVHATNIDRILDSQPGSDRHAILDGRVDLSGLDLKPFRRVRNHPEHFDERLDRWVRDSIVMLSST